MIVTTRHVSAGRNPAVVAVADGTTHVFAIARHATVLANHASVLRSALEALGIGGAPTVASVTRDTITWEVVQ